MKKQTKKNGKEPTTISGGDEPTKNVAKNSKTKNDVYVVNTEEHILEKSKGDEYEYDYEGDMAMSQLKSIMSNAKQLHDMLEPNTNLPEWVQSKITLAKDYIETARDYVQTQMNEEVIDEGRALTFQQRLARGRQMKRIEPRVYRGQIRYQDRVPSESRLRKRAERMARNIIKMKISHTPYDQMSIPEKIMVDKILERKQQAIRRLAQRLLPKVRKISIERISGAGAPPMPRQTLKMGEETIPHLSESVNTIYALAAGEETKAVRALREKAEKANVSFETILEVYSEALQEYTPRKISSEQYAFNAVNSFVSNKINEDFKQMSVNQMFNEIFIGPQGEAEDPISAAVKTIATKTGRKVIPSMIDVAIAELRKKKKEPSAWSRRAGRFVDKDQESPEDK